MDDRIAIIALTTPLGLTPAEIDKIAPISIRTWSRLTTWFDRGAIGAASLYERSTETEAVLTAIDPSLPLCVEQLLSRCERVERAVSELEDRGIWIATIGERGYPKRWTRTLGSTAPPLVYGDGVHDNVDRPAIGIVGSRDISERLIGVANDLGAKAVLGDFAVVSGGARGADRIGMNGALDVGGTVIGILPDHLQRERLRRQNRDDIDVGNLTMISVVHPDTPFIVGNAMYRNRLIYALSELTIVVSASDGTGGTWAGAIENLKHRWAPLAVWTGSFAPKASHRLVDHGAIALNEIPASSNDVRALLHDVTNAFDAKGRQSSKANTLQLGLFES
ncbi:MAG TPA: DNA-processing protein DprA [Thermomicrobiales bacterium]|nr:DNA-processing protein DprA [Thermomicrobiales bacterium]